MALEDLTQWFENIRNPSEEVDADTIITNITSTYQEDLNIRDAAVRQAEQERDALKEREQKLMAENYKLLMKQPAANVGGDGGTTDSGSGDSEQERAATVTFADIFNKGDK